MTGSASLERSPDWMAIAYMAFLHIGALFALFPSNFSWGAVGITLFLHWATGCLGLTTGLHRLVSHRSFQAPKWLEYFLVFWATLACQGSLVLWVGLHRLHHLYPDQKGDPHNSALGLSWSHMAWMLHKGPAIAQVPLYTKDIAEDPVYKFYDKYMFLIQILLGVFLYWLGGWPFVVWGIFVRLVLVFHCTFLVNSAAHTFGYRTYETNDRSKNCWWVALLTYGEGWHNNHHAFPYSARQGLKRWEVDPTWITIRFLMLTGLVQKVKLVGTSNKVQHLSARSEY